MKTIVILYQIVWEKSIKNDNIHIIYRHVAKNNTLDFSVCVQGMKFVRTNDPRLSTFVGTFDPRVLTKVTLNFRLFCTGNVTF